MSIRKFLNKYEDLAKELLRCGSCQNILLHSGNKYKIVKIGKTNEEGIICETCQQNNRNIELATRISDDDDDDGDINNHISQIPVSHISHNEELVVEEEEGK